jgi:hypothetical protein
MLTDERKPTEVARLATDVIQTCLRPTNIEWIDEVFAVGIKDISGSSFGLRYID